MKCRNCGKEIIKNNNFCNNCGTRVNNEKKLIILALLRSIINLLFLFFAIKFLPETNSFFEFFIIFIPMYIFVISIPNILIKISPEDVSKLSALTIFVYGIIGGLTWIIMGMIKDENLLIIIPLILLFPIYIVLDFCIDFAISKIIVKK